MTYANLIGGRWCEGAETTANINPSNTAEVVGLYARATAEELLRDYPEAARRHLQRWMGRKIEYLRV